MEITNIDMWRELVSKQLKSMAEALEMMHIELIKYNKRITKLEKQIKNRKKVFPEDD